jgi:hypothetical protein
MRWNIYDGVLDSLPVLSRSRDLNLKLDCGKKYSHERRVLRDIDTVVCGYTPSQTA